MKPEVVPVPHSASEPPPAAAADDAVLLDVVRAALARHGGDDWRVTPAEYWCHVEPPAHRHRVQGWKLHVSATPLSAPIVLARVAAVLISRAVPFKFATTLHKAAELVSRHIERGSGGKFVTVYPDGGDDQLRDLAAELDRVTSGLPGPGVLSDRQYRPGSLVHYRYGAFRGIPVLGNDGVYEVMLRAPDGSAVLDQRLAWYTPPPWAPRDPFSAPPPTRAGNGTPPPGNGTPPSGGGPAVAPTPKPVLLDDRYVVAEVIRHSFPGGVFRALDRHTGGEVIIKQARPYAGADATGRDVRDARRHEAAMLRKLDGSGRTPRFVALFEQQGDVFLVQEAIDGRSLRRWVPIGITPADNDRWGPDPSVARRMARDLVDLVDLAHGAGLVLRDLNPGNVMVTDAGELRLIDLEALAEPGRRVVRTYTPGYGAPEVTRGPFAGEAPDPRSDLFSLGATLFFLVTGADPVLPPDDGAARTHHDRVADRLARVGVANAAARDLAPVVLDLLDDDPARRPTLTDLRRRLAHDPPGADPGPADARPAGPAPVGSGPVVPALVAPAPVAPAPVDQMIGDAVAYLDATRAPDADADRLWPAGPHGPRTDAFNVQHGAAGVLGVLARAHRVAPETVAAATVAQVARWITTRVSREPRVLPGLYLGRSGTAWALLEAGEATGDSDLVGEAVLLARQVPLCWPNPDVYHGVAGAGLTQLRFWEATGDPGFLARARQAADAVVRAAERTGASVSWPVPTDFASAMAGSRSLGFAHGVAGVGAFLLAVGRATGEAGYLDLALAAAATLAHTAQDDRGAAYWPSGDRPGPMTAHLCNGSSGIGTFLAAAWRHSDDNRLGEIVAAAARAVRRMRWPAPAAQCHGLAGDGEFLLDVATVTGQARYRDWAAEVAEAIHSRSAWRDGRLIPAGETGEDFCADFSTGAAGVLAFLLRLRYGGSRSWLPATLYGTATRSERTRSDASPVDRTETSVAA